VSCDPAASPARPRSSQRRSRPGARRGSDGESEESGDRRRPVRRPRGVRAGGDGDRPVLRARAHGRVDGPLHEEPPRRAHARGARGRPNRRWRRRVPVRAHGAGGHGRDGGRDRRRYLPHAPPARRPALDDARPARRRARARGARRPPLGVRGDDLRQVRLRDGLALRGDLAPDRVRGVCRAARREGAVRIVELDEAPGSSCGSGTACAADPHAARSRNWWSTASSSSHRRRRAEALRRPERDGRPRVRDLPPQAQVRAGVPDSTRGGGGGSTAGRPPSLALPRYRLARE
jgi:hypothetical protein